MSETTPSESPLPEQERPSEPTAAETVPQPEAAAEPVAEAEPMRTSPQPEATDPLRPAPFASPQPVSASTGVPPADARPRSVAVPMIAAAVVAALLGGGVGAGVAAWAITSQYSAAPQAGSPQTITVNNPGGVDVVTAVAAKAAPSVVTIAVSSGGGSGTGSGVILSEDGYVLTNTHVVTLEGASADGTIEVTTADGRIYRAEVVGLDPVVDLAVIKLEGASGLTPVEWGDSTRLDVGDQVVAIGAPLGLANTVTDGIVSALDRSIQIASSAVPEAPGDTEEAPEGGQSPFDFWNFDRGEEQRAPSTNATISLPVIQTDAAINPGNSGGALVDDEGRLVGINVAIASTGSVSGQNGSIGVGFAIPAELARRVADELIETGAATHGLLGATVSTATSEESDVVGAVVREVTPGGAAEDAGLRAGDVVTEFAGIPITSSTDLTAQVRALAAGETAELRYLRGGDSRTVTVVLGTLEL